MKEKEKLNFRLIEEIQEEKGLNDYKMASLLGCKTVWEYQKFKRSKKALNVPKMVTLWRISGWSAKKFLERLEEDIKDEH
jgi:hypothetical protein